jgi:hypothetical protein
MSRYGGRIGVATEFGHGAARRVSHLPRAMNVTDGKLALRDPKPQDCRRDIRGRCPLRKDHDKSLRNGVRERTM